MQQYSGHVTYSEGRNVSSILEGKPVLIVHLKDRDGDKDLR
jgi:hypothetical protein